MIFRVIRCCEVKGVVLLSLVEFFVFYFIDVCVVFFKRWVVGISF